MLNMQKSMRSAPCSRKAVVVQAFSAPRAVRCAVAPRPACLLKKSFFDGMVDLSVGAAPRMMMRSKRCVSIEAVKKSVGDLTKADLTGKRVFVRADLNVPLDKKTLAITDDTRIRAVSSNS